MQNTQGSQGHHHGLILLAGVSYILATLIIATKYKMQMLDVALLGAVVVSLLLLGFQRFMVKADATHKMVNLVQVVIALIVALRFGVPLLKDFESLSTLLLFGSIIVFFYIAITGLMGLFMPKPAATTTAPEPERKIDPASPTNDEA